MYREIQQENNGKRKKLWSNEKSFLFSYLKVLYKVVYKEFYTIKLNMFFIAMGVYDCMIIWRGKKVF